MIIGFIGLGNMGTPMAANLVKAGLQVYAYDLNKEACACANERGCIIKTIEEVVTQSQILITMLPDGPIVSKIYNDVVFPLNPQDNQLMIDCSTIDVETSRLIHEKAEQAGYSMLDAPVSGGVGGAENAALTFMCGGLENIFNQAQSILDKMGKNIIHCGAVGNGQAAKICNNMMLGIQMISVCEGFALAGKLGLAHEKLFEVSSKSSGQCWSLNSYCPVPGPVPSSPANHDYVPGFSVEMMEKDLNLAQKASEKENFTAGFGQLAYDYFHQHRNQDGKGKDFSSIMAFIQSKELSV